MDEKLQRTLGEAARAARLRLGLTQEEVARKVGLAQSVYGRIERGGMMPSVPTLRKLCLALETSPETLLSLGKPQGAPAAEPGEHPELSRIIHLLREWPPEQLLLVRKLLEVVNSQHSK
jgi:transcriptional regulator with XRE-family HTH domain